ncbi:L-asparaginase [Rhodobacter sp. TJ_12]|uniref:asparaginase n=1 Tax=Rhodobacter sp. TJ_12 TaxID=2029399 RepID=UPI001CBD303A|nr:asparaginase [Rhodobacter sp. TJ_12]MBZ4020943.1 L-asparaginase [Rhodobacter sp. TJ_12]
MAPQTLIELWRGGLCESEHAGHAVVYGPQGPEMIWGQADAVIFPRSSCKMIQALPLVESGAADVAGLTDRQLALACASHSGAALHTQAVATWLKDLGLADDDLRCGAHVPRDPVARRHFTCTEETPCQIHNNCSGKHAGFLTLNRHLKGGPDYIEIDHPVQRAVRATFEEVTQETAAGWGIDGCSAPNFACTIGALARAMQFFAAATPEGGLRENAAVRLRQAMVAFPELVAGEERACTKLMRATGGKVAVKVGAEGVFVAILPDQKRGVALKIADGTNRAAEAAITSILVNLGALDPAHPVVEEFLPTAQRNWRGLETGGMRRAEGFC